MEFSQDLLIDWALTAGGYIASGALAVVIYSMFKDRAIGSAASRRPVPRFELSAEAPARPARPAITLTRGPETAEPKPKQEHDTVSTYQRSNLLAQEGYRRNRTGAIRVARELVRAGASSEQIRAVLPISEAELAMLRQEQN